MAEQDENVSSKENFNFETVLNMDKSSGIKPSPKEDADELLDIHQLCHCCLNVTKVISMRNTYIDGLSSVSLYEDISKIHSPIDNIPSVMCVNCTKEFEQIGKFAKMLRRSYDILEMILKEMDQLKKQDGSFQIKKSIILKNALKNRALQNIDFKDSNCDYMLKNDCSSAEKDSESSVDDDNDEIPLSEKFKSFINKKKESKVLAHRKRTNSRKILSKMEETKVKDGLDSLHDKNDLNFSTEFNDSDQLSMKYVCPVCSKRNRDFSQHLQTVHFLDWINSKCLQCSYENDKKDKLVEHCRECSQIEQKPDVPDFVDSSHFKVELNEESDEADFGDNESYGECQRFEIKIGNKRQISSKRKRPKKYSCNKCKDVSYNCYKDIECHLKTNHEADSKCILCKLEFSNSFSLLYHMMVKHGKLKCCRLCLISFKNADDLNAHYKSEEHNTKCTVCGEQFKNRKAVYEHRRKKHLNPQLENQKYKCPECPKEFSNPNNIKRHILVSHNDVRFLCDTCGQSYTTQRNLRLHIQKFHEGIQVENKLSKKNFFCETCGKELKIFHKYAIAMHRAKHKGHNFVCKKCYDSFATEDDFKKHVQDLGHQLYECDKCQAQFVREENLKNHLKNHDAPGWNKNMFATWGKSAKLRNEKGEFVCSYCPKVFKDKQRLDNHVRVHTNERPYKCHICSKGFKTWIHRKTHLNIHLGIKKWTCKYCSRAFTNSCTLKGHEMVHTGERPHRCPECRKGFITLSAMKKHRMVHFKTGGVNYGKKDKVLEKNIEKPTSDPEPFLYKYDQMFAGSDVSYETFVEPPKEATVNLIAIHEELTG